VPAEKTKIVMWLESSEGAAGQNCIADETTAGFAEKFPNIEVEMIDESVGEFDFRTKRPRGVPDV
jgi:hypothetical protein